MNMEKTSTAEAKKVMPVVKSLRFNIEEPDIEDSTVFEDPNLAQLEHIHDVWDAIELCEEHGVPYEGLGDLEDFLERLKLHFKKQTLTESEKDGVSPDHFVFSAHVHYLP